MNITKQIKDFVTLEIPNKRIYGLDIVRALAILIVMFLHSSRYMKVDYSIHLPGGVHLFFILSGFLIGSILIQLFEEKEYTLKGLLKDFWYRRWMRTLPIYYILLVFYIFLSFFIHNEPLLGKVKYFFFLQNVFSTNYYFFGESWSLTIEEWFYIFIPILFMLVYKIGIGRYMPFFLLGFIIIGVCARFYFLNHPKYSSIAPTFMPAQFHIPAFGVLAAYIYRRYKDIIYRNRVWLLIFPLTRWYIAKAPLLMGITIVLILLYPSNFKSLKKSNWILAPILIFLAVKYSHPLFHYSGSIMEITLTSFVLYFVSIKNGQGLLYKFLTYTSLISYSLYLTHGHFIQNFVLDSFLFDWAPNHFKLVFFWILSYLVGFLCYKFIELPFLRIRDKQ